MAGTIYNKKTKKFKWTDEDTLFFRDNCRYMTVPELMEHFDCSESRLRSKATLHGFVLVRKGEEPAPRPRAKERAHG
jgi:hypothetical protein